MDLFHRPVLNKLVMALDIAVALVAFAFAALLARPSVSFVEIIEYRFSLLQCVGLVAMVFAWHAAFVLSGLYRSRRRHGLRQSLLMVAFGATLITGTLLIWKLVTNAPLLTLDFLALFWALALSMLAVFRTLVRATLQYLRRHNRNLRHHVIVGTNPRALAVAERIAAGRHLGYRIAGFIDDRWPGMEDHLRFGPLLSELDDLSVFLRDKVVDEVIICLPLASYHRQTRQMVALCQHLSIDVSFPPDQFAQDLGVPTDDADRRVLVHASNSYGWTYVIKRLFDFSFALIAILALLPFFIAIALAVKLTSPGDPLFVQQRIGRNRRRFPMFKFRTMHSGAEERLAELEARNEMGGPVFKLRDDPRVTPLGRFLRRTSLDELPQLFNVLRGEMSLVGPRPLPERDHSKFTEDVYRRRTSMHPGITCLWQIAGRSNLNYDEWMRLDLSYIDNWSLWLDFKILIKTLPVVLRRSGAF